VVGPAAVLAPLNRAAAVVDAAPVNQPAVLKDPVRISIDEMKALQSTGEPVVIVDARSARTYEGDPLTAVGSVRLQPDDPVRDAREQQLSKHANLVVYCA
jgi:3-mercaptopyruvate sulfurtransferase SseA